MKNPPPRRPAAPRDAEAQSDDDYARGAAPLPPRSTRVPPPAPRSAVPLARSAEDVVPTFELRSDGGTMEGARIGFARRLRELARGVLPVFETLDLHGMTAEKAEVAVRSFCATARGTVARTVLIIHGKGLHSPDGQPVLRDEVAHWLSTAPIARDVLCFVTARPKHGGSGAMYVHLAARPTSPGVKPQRGA